MPALFCCRLLLRRRFSLIGFLGVRFRSFRLGVFISSRIRFCSVGLDRDLARLSEILGALHYLRSICGANEGQKWRDEMQALIDAEVPTGERHNRMIASFNRGYQGFQQTYRTCTPAADFAIRRYLDEGSRIARDITGRYAN